MAFSSAEDATVESPVEPTVPAPQMGELRDAQALERLRSLESSQAGLQQRVAELHASSASGVPPATEMGLEPVLKRLRILEESHSHLEESNTHLVMTLGSMRIHQDQMEKFMAIAVTTLQQIERMQMEEQMDGGRVGRVVCRELRNFRPAGTMHGWHSAAVCVQNRLLEVRSWWVHTCRRRGLTPTADLWSHIVEASYKGALQESSSPAEKHDLQEKIEFWRKNIPEAAGVVHTNTSNALKIQRRMQVNGSIGSLDMGCILQGDLLPWTYEDLQGWTEDMGNRSATGPAL